MAADSEGTRCEEGLNPFDDFNMSAVDSCFYAVDDDGESQAPLKSRKNHSQRLVRISLSLKPLLYEEKVYQI